MTGSTMPRTGAIVDAWAQPARPDFLTSVPEVARLLQQSGSTEIAARGYTADEYVAAMDAAGVDTVVLSAWCRPGRWVFTNDEIAEYVRAYPARFVGCASVDLDKPVEAVRELRRCVVELGFKALRVVPWLWRLPPDHRLYYPLYVACIELGIPFCTQVGHTGPLMPSETGRPVPYLDQVALDFPELVIVGGHIGHPWTDEMIGVAWKHANVHIDTSAYLPRYYPPQLLHYMRTYGQDKVLFGTNFPQLPFDRCVEQVRALGLPADVEAKFLGSNAQRVFALEHQPA